MSDAPIRKFVKPAHPGACIPDPAHNRDLPQDGMEVVWDHYWIGRETSGDVTVSEPKPASPAPAPVPDENSPGDPPKVDGLKNTEIAKPLKG